MTTQNLTTLGASAVAAPVDAAAQANAAREEGETAAKVRISTIISCEAAQGANQALAQSLAFGSSMSAEEAEKHLIVASQSTSAAVDEQKAASLANADEVATEAGFLAAKENAGTLGLSLPVATPDKEKSIASEWDEA